jgi:diguanylate cyclase (GGDEF)-like protein
MLCAGGRPDGFRVLLIDGAKGIHEDISKVLCPLPVGRDALDELEARVLGTKRVSEKARLEFRIDSAFQGEQGIRLVERAVAESDPYAIAFVDVQTSSGLDGVETLARIWQIDPRMQAVVCTAYSKRSWDDMVRALGFTDRMLVLRKPFDAIEVLQLAHALSYKWQLARNVEQHVAELEDKVAERTRHLEAANLQLMREVSQRQKAEEELRHLAMHDPLTGLPNRLLLRDRLDGAIARARRAQSNVAVLMVDLDNFKDVNDSFGHAAGDELLREMTSRITHALRACDSVARLGGDEFVIVLEDIADPEGAALVAQRVLETCERQVRVASHGVRTPASIGIAVFPNDGADSETLLKSADLAMYDAKSSGRGAYRFYSEEMRVSTLRKVELRERIELGLAREQFALFYQPLTDVVSGKTLGMEALIRWHDPEVGLVSPLHFIPVAETSGLIVPMGRWVLRTACAQLARWRAQGLTELSVAVNVSPRQLRAPDFHADVQRALSDYGVPPATLEIEITESAAMEDVENARECLGRLAELGVKIMIDDFGSGYSSLVRLKELPIRGLKIDRLFIKHIDQDPRDAAIVTAIVGMAHSLNLEVVAEGIETAEQLAVLRAISSEPTRPSANDRAQGFLFSKPLPVEAATRFLLEPGRADIYPIRAAG